MVVTDRDVNLLHILLTYGFLVVSQIRSRLFPTDRDGSCARPNERKLGQAGYIQRRRAEVANPLSSNTIPVYVITREGRNLLALRRNDAQILLQEPPCTRSWVNFAHYVDVSERMMQLGDCVDAQQYVTMNNLCFEHTIVRAEESDPEKRYRLYTITSPLTDSRRVVCAPDAAFELQIGNYRRAYYLENERGSDTPVRVAAKKCLGFAGLRDRQLWKNHYPKADGFRVLCLAPNSSWRDAMAKAMKGKAGEELWMFASVEDLNAQSWLHAEVWITTDGSKRPLVKLPKALPQQV